MIYGLRVSFSSFWCFVFRVFCSRAFIRGDGWVLGGVRFSEIGDFGSGLCRIVICILVILLA